MCPAAAGRFLQGRVKFSEAGMEKDRGSAPGTKRSRQWSSTRAGEETAVRSAAQGGFGEPVCSSSADTFL